ncbi:MAG: hypothetical protein M5U09_12915 [Gammaproteobacteria bacterium]|nr:hypothetical protein [Gammaproteobacteria bacterium]
MTAAVVIAIRFHNAHAEHVEFRRQLALAGPAGERLEAEVVEDVKRARCQRDRQPPGERQARAGQHEDQDRGDRDEDDRVGYQCLRHGAGSSA